MPHFRSKPVVIEACRVDHLIHDAQHNWRALPAWVRAAYEAGNLIIRPDGLDVLTLEGKLTAARDAWLVRGTETELYPVKDSIFRAKYVPVEAAQA